MKVTQDAILQAAATITAARIQVAGALVAGKGIAPPKIDVKQLLEDAIGEVSVAIEKAGKHSQSGDFKAWRAAE